MPSPRFVMSERKSIFTFSRQRLLHLPKYVQNSFVVKNPLLFSYFFIIYKIFFTLNKEKKWENGHKTYKTLKKCQKRLKTAQKQPFLVILRLFSGHFCGHFYFQKWAESGQMAKKVTKNHKF